MTMFNVFGSKIRTAYYQGSLGKIKSKILSNLFNKKYWLKQGEFNNTTGTERVKQVLVIKINCLRKSNKSTTAHDSLSAGKIETYDTSKKKKPCKQKETLKNLQTKNKMQLTKNKIQLTKKRRYN